MATTMGTHARMAMGYGDLVTDGSNPTIALTNCSAASGYSTANLKLEDPSHVLVTTAPTADPVLSITWASSLPTSDILIGFVNYSFLRGYDYLRVEASSNGTNWSQMGDLDLKTSVPALLMEIEPDFLVLPAAQTTSRYWRITWVLASGTRPALTIGNVLFMRRHHFAKNPTRDVFPHSLDVELQEERALGGVLHITRGPTRLVQSAEYTFTRLDEAGMAKLVDVASVYSGRLVGIIPPNQSNRVLPWGLAGHLFGRLTRLRVQPSPGTTDTTHLNNVTMTVAAGW